MLTVSWRLSSGRDTVAAATSQVSTQLAATDCRTTIQPGSNSRVDPHPRPHGPPARLGARAGAWWDRGALHCDRPSSVIWWNAPRWESRALGVGNPSFGIRATGGH